MGWSEGGVETGESVCEEAGEGGGVEWRERQGGAMRGRELRRWVGGWSGFGGAFGGMSAAQAAMPVESFPGHLRASGGAQVKEQYGWSPSMCFWQVKHQFTSISMVGWSVCLWRQFIYINRDLDRGSIYNRMLFIVLSSLLLSLVDEPIPGHPEVRVLIVTILS